MRKYSTGLNRFLAPDLKWTRVDCSKELLISLATLNATRDRVGKPFCAWKEKKERAHCSGLKAAVAMRGRTRAVSSEHLLSLGGRRKTKEGADNLALKDYSEVLS